MDKDCRYQCYVGKEPRKRRLKHGTLFPLVVICPIAAFVPPSVIDTFFGVGDEQSLIIVH